MMPIITLTTTLLFMVFVVLTFVINPYASPNDFYNPGATVENFDIQEDDPADTRLIEWRKAYKEVFTHKYYNRAKMYLTADSVYAPLENQRYYKRLDTLDATRSYFLVVHPHFIKEFIDKILPQIQVLSQVCIVDDPYNSTDESIGENIIKPLMTNEYVDLWLSDWNKASIPPEVKVMPIGFSTRDTDQIKILEEMCTSMPLNKNRPVKVFCNAHLATYDNPASGHGNERKIMYDALKRKPFIHFINNRDSILSTWNKHRDFAFELCPEGNGIDTHRIYECFALGCIPIVKRNSLTPLYETFGPILVLCKWSDLTEELLLSFHRNNSEKVVIDPEILTFNHWYTKVTKKNPL